jgi:capsular polysaccharide biosynthesis protein
MELRHLLEIIWERKIAVVLVCVFCTAGAAAYTLKPLNKEYESSATVAFLPGATEGQYGSTESVSALLSTYSVVAQSAKTMHAAGVILGRPITASISASATQTGGWIVLVNGQGTSAREVAQSVNAVAEVLTKQVGAIGPLHPSIIERASAAGAPIESRPKQIILPLAALVGLFGGVLLALLIDNVGGQRPRSEAMTGRTTGAEDRH